MSDYCYNITLTPTRSNTVQAIGYDPAPRTLAVRHIGVVRYFQHVPRAIYQEFMRTPSKKDYFNHVIIPHFVEFNPLQEFEGFPPQVPAVPPPRPVNTGKDLDWYRNRCTELADDVKHQKAELARQQEEFASQQEELARQRDELARLTKKIEDARMLSLSAQQSLTDERSRSAKLKLRARISAGLLILTLLIGFFAIPRKLQDTYNSGFSSGYKLGASEQDSSGTDKYGQGYSDGYQAASSSSGSAQSSSGKSSPDSSQPQTYTVYVTATGSKYHRAGCSYLKSSRAISLADAIAAGYTPCSRCW